jgi:hypothetical protein
VGLRPDDPGVTSAAYRDVPIESFGAALLRVMGWQGPSDDALAKERLDRKGMIESCSIYTHIIC